MSVKPLESLASEWRAEIERLRAWGANETATVLERCVNQLSDRMETWQDEELCLADASDESGYSVAHLRRLISQGALRDIGQDAPVLVRRGDLPRKPGYTPNQVPILRTV